MLSFGQRLKLLRSEADISQSDLADALGVSAQSVSKWECDAYCPDLSLLLPLSAVLGVTADCLLGAGSNEKEDFEEYKKDISELKETLWKPGKDNRYYLMYLKAKEFLKKYPLNYEVKLDCASYLNIYICQGTKDKCFEMPTDEFNELWDEGVNMLLSLKKRDNDPSRIAHVCGRLIDYYILKDKWTEAESVALELPEDPIDRVSALFWIACGKRDFKAAEELAKMSAIRRGSMYNDILCSLAGRISIFGNVRKEEAIDAFKNMYDNACEFEEFFGDDPDCYLSSKQWQISALAHISCCCIAIDRIDDALDCTEKVTEIVCELFNKVKETNFNQDDREKELSAVKFFPLIWCYNDVFADDDNILTREERYKTCKARIDALE